MPRLVRATTLLRTLGLTPERTALAPAFATLLILYLLAHAAPRLLMWQSLEYDEAEQLVFAQRLALWYSPQPPLYTWLVSGPLWTFGPGILALSLVRFGLLAAMYLMLYRLASRVAPPRVAAVAAFAPLLCPTFAWESVRTMTHTALVCVAALGTVLSVARLRAGAGPGSFALLGAWLGVGVLSKYNFALFALALAAAVATLREYRAAVFRRGLWLTVAVAAAVTGPHLSVALGRADEVRQEVHNRAHAAASAGASVAAAGLANAATGLLIALGGAVMLSRICRPEAGAPADTAAPPGDTARLLGRALALSALLLVALTAASGARRVPVHWLAPALLLAPLWLLSTDRVVPVRRLARAAALLATAAVAVAGARALPLADTAEGRSQSRDHAYAELRARIAAAGLEAAPVLAADPVAGGYVRLQNPAARVQDGKNATGPLPASDRWVVVWNGAKPPQLAELVERLGFDPAHADRAQAIVGPLRGRPTKQHVVGYLFLVRDP